jgi:transposase
MTTNVKLEYDQVWGIDVSKDWLDISIDGKVKRIDQTVKEIETFIKKHPVGEKQTLVVLESTGGYEQLAVSCLVHAGFLVHVAHPNKVRYFAKAKGLLAKTDKLDAQMIEGYGRFINPDDIHALMSEKEVKINGFSTRLHQLKLLHHQESCRLGRAKNKLVKTSHQEMLLLLEKQREAFEAELLKIIEADEELSRKYSLVKSMKGVGPVLGMTLIADLPELGRLTKKEVAALVGVAPMVQESGKYRGKGRTQCGRESVRRVLYMGALVAAHYNSRYKSFYEKLLAKGKPKKVALVAVMRKMIVTLNAMVQTNTPFKA